MKSDRAVVTMRNSPALQGRGADAVGRVLGERGYDDAGGAGLSGECSASRGGGRAPCRAGGRTLQREGEGAQYVESRRADASSSVLGGREYDDGEEAGISGLSGECSTS